MKAHLAISPDAPLVEGRDQTALCGALVQKARFPFIWDYYFPANFGVALNRINTCGKCYDKVGEIGSGTVYGLLSGGEAKDAEGANDD